MQPIEIKMDDVRAVIAPINDNRGLWRVEIWSETIGRAGSHLQSYGTPERCLRFAMDWAEATADASVWPMDRWNGAGANSRHPPDYIAGCGEVRGDSLDKIG